MKSFAIVVAILLLAAVSAAARDSEQVFERTLKVSGPVDLEAMTDAGGIFVKPGPAGSVRIRGVLKASNGRWLNLGDVESRIQSLVQNPPIEQSGNTVRVGHVSGDMLRGIQMRLEILTPPDTKLRARADSGGINVEGINGMVDCATDSGGINASDLGSEIHASADSGGIRIRNVKGRVYARADSGGIEVTEVGGPVDAQADSGGIRIEQTQAAPIRARADSGGATVRLASTGGYDIRADSGSGHLTVPEMVVNGTISKHRAQGKVRGGGALVDIQVDSGNVHIQ